MKQERHKFSDKGSKRSSFETLSEQATSLPPTKSVLSDESSLEQSERYNFVKMLGSGGMGQVWIAFDRKLERNVAIKRIKQELIYVQACYRESTHTAEPAFSQF